MALISENFLQDMFDPMPSPQDQTTAQPQGLEFEQNNQAPVVTANTVDTTTTAPPQPLPPTIPGYKGSFEGAVAGGQEKQEYRKEDMFDLNTNYLTKIQDQVTQLNTEYATTIFQTLGKLPSINGRQIPLSEFSKIFKEDKKQAKQLLEQAAQFEDDPNLDAETSWNLKMNNYNSLELSAKYNVQKNKFDNNFREMAVGADANTENPYDYEFNFHQALFDEKGNLRTKEQFDKVIKQKYEDIRTKGFLSDLTKLRNTRVYLPSQRRFVDETELQADQREINRQLAQGNPLLDSNSLYNRFYGQTTKGIRQGYAGGNDNRPVWSLNTREDFEEYQSLLNKQKKLDKAVKSNSYESVLGNLKKYYNEEKTKSIYIGADEEGMLTSQKGGDKQSPTGAFDFNFSDMKWKDRSGNIVFKPQIREFITLASLMTDPESGATASFGKVGGDVPDSDSEKEAIAEVMKLVLEDIQIPGEKYTDAQKRHKSHKFAGSVSFQGIVGGEQKYHAFHIKITNDYFNQSKYSGGTKGEDGKIVKENPEIATDGFTIYIPANLSSKKTNLGIKFKESTTVSGVESLLNMNSDVTLPFKGAGNIELTKQADDSVRVAGYVVNFRPDTYNFDTISLKPKVFKYDRATDIDGYLREQILPVLQQNYILNKQLKEAVDAMRAVKDPAKLQQPQE